MRMLTHCGMHLEVQQVGQKFKVVEKCQTGVSFGLEPAKLMDCCMVCPKAEKSEKPVSKPLVLSPTAVSKYRQCERLYAFEYNEGLRPPPSTKQEFGIAVHKQLERWLRDGVACDDTPEGRTAYQGIEKGWLPKPDSRLIVESRFELPVRDGLSVAGYIDCVAPPEVTGEDPLIIDHKSTSDLRWAKTEEQLLIDPQTLIYGMWAMLHFQCPTARARWLYYAATNPKDDSPRQPRGAKPVEVQLSNKSPAFMEGIQTLLADFEAMASIRAGNQPGLSFPPTPESCGAFGGCFHMERCNLTASDRLAAYIEKGY